VGAVTTGVLFGVSLALFAVTSWRSSLPSDPLRPRLLPWRLIMIGSGAAALLLLVHLLNLFGVETGHRPR
jgi:multisubunit Na+/H+ antiporter MnhB subunit